MTYVAILLGSVTWCAGILFAPYLAASSAPVAELIYRFFQPLCHQRPERSFQLFGEPLAVCVRCSSVYFSFLAGVLAYPALRRFLASAVSPRIIIPFAVLPVVVEVVAEWAGVYASTILTRTLTGGVLGFVLALVVLPAAIEGVQQLAQRKSTTLLSTID